MKYFFLLLVLVLAIVSNVYAHHGCRSCKKRHDKWTQWADPHQHVDKAELATAEGWIHRNYAGCNCFPCGKARSPCHERSCTKTRTKTESESEERPRSCDRCKKRRCHRCRSRSQSWDDFDNDDFFIY